MLGKLKNKGKALKNYIRALECLKKCKKRKSDKITIVFLVQYIPAWNKVKAVYEKMLFNSGIKVYLLCVPMEKKIGDIVDFDFTENGTYEYFRERGYNVINALEYSRNWFDLEKLLPDYVIYTRPYNNFLPKLYRSDAVAEYSKICVFLYGMPLSSIGYMHVINRDFFDYVYCYFAEDEEIAHIYHRKFWLGCFLKLQKVVSLGIPALEEQYHRKDGKTEIWNFGTMGLRCLWLPRWSTDDSVGGSNFFQYKGVLINYFKNRSRMKLLIRPHPLMFQNFINTKEWTFEQKEEFVEICESTENISLDESKEYAETLWNTDVLITDLTSMIVEYFITGNPIIYCMPKIPINLTKTMNKILSACYVVKNEKELRVALDQIMNGKDPLRERRKELNQQLFSQSVKGCSDSICSEILKW